MNLNWGKIVPNLWYVVTIGTKSRKIMTESLGNNQILEGQQARKEQKLKDVRSHNYTELVSMGRLHWQGRAIKWLWIFDLSKWWGSVRLNHLSFKNQNRIMCNKYNTCIFCIVLYFALIIWSIKFFKPILIISYFLTTLKIN